MIFEIDYSVILNKINNIEHEIFIKENFEFLYISLKYFRIFDLLAMFDVLNDLGHFEFFKHLFDMLDVIDDFKHFELFEHCCIKYKTLILYITFCFYEIVT